MLYIKDINNVKADENCGFRMIIVALGYGKDIWDQVRTHIL